MKKLILIVFGTRPEAIKMAPLVHALKEDSDSFDVRVCVTAQHRGLLDQVLQIFCIRPDVDLDLMKPSQDLFSLTGAVILQMRGVLSNWKPDVVLVHGDTTTALSSAIASFYSGCLVGHVEAGLRTFDTASPFPEEFNRQLISRIARWHFAPTETNREHLIKEGVPSKRVAVTGNTVIDSLRWILRRINENQAHRNMVYSSLDSSLPFEWRSKRFILITLHRRENFGNAIKNICSALRELALRFRDIHFLYPVHPNPNVNAPVRTLLSDVSNIHLVEPFSYEHFIVLLNHSHFIITDSGGIQEEAPSLGKPVLLMRDATERQEAIINGSVKLVGTDQKYIVESASQLILDESYYKRMAVIKSPFGDGNACQKIVSILRNEI